MSAKRNAGRPAGTRSSSTSPVRRGRSWVFPTVLGVIVLAGVVAVVVSSTGGSDSGSGGAPAVREVSREVTVSGTALPRYTAAKNDPAVGLAAPRIASVDFRDRTSVAGGATGEPYVLAFLAHWCPHCQAEVPRLVAVERAGKDAGVPVVAVTTGTDETAPNYPPSVWLARERWRGAELLDDATQTAARAYGLGGYPFLVWVAADGTVAARTSGEIPEGDLPKMFAALAAGNPVPVPDPGAASGG